MPTKTKNRIQSKQTISGIINFEAIQEIDPNLKIKIAVVRDCRIIVSRVFELAENLRKLDFSIQFEHEFKRPIGVRLIVGPDVSDEQLRSIEHHQTWLPANSFTQGIVKDVELKITEKIYKCWLLCCRIYTLRGRVICRKIVWDPNEQRFVICDAPVRGARVTASDVDCIWWWCRADEVGSDYTDINGNFEIKFMWCCWWWRPWILKKWQLEPFLVDKIRDLLRRVPLTIPIPQPDPVPDFNIFEPLIIGTNALSPQPVPPDVPEITSENIIRVGEELVRRLPRSLDLEDLGVWPWRPHFDCKPDIIFNVTQDCGEGEQVIYSEGNLQTRWNIDSVLDGVTLIANENACCPPFCCSDPPDENCLVFHGIGCGSYPIELIEQNTGDPLVGYARPGTADRPFGGSLRLLGEFGNASDVDFYKLQYRRIIPSPTIWNDLPPDQVGSFLRRYWTGGIPLFQNEIVALQNIDGQNVLKTIKRYRDENPGLPNVDPDNSEWLGIWHTARIWTSAGGTIRHEAPRAGLVDGVYELRVVGYRYDQANNKLIDERIMAVCPPQGQNVDPDQHATFRIRLDNRVMSSAASSTHLNTTEPDCDYPDICAVVKNEGRDDEEYVKPCGFVRVSAGDTITIHFQASDSDGHLDAYSLTAHWAESEVFNVLGVGSLAGDPTPEYGHTYNQALTQGALRPHWYGGNFKVTVTVGDPVQFTQHLVFETCCAYLLRLRVWKRTTNGCTGPYYFHHNTCEFSFTVIREDLIGNPAHPSCSELCPPVPTITDGSEVVVQSES